MSREMDRWLRKNSFIEKPTVEKEINYDDLIPILHYKVNNNIRFKGKRVEFGDMTTFIKQDDTYYPKFYVDTIKDDAIEVDLAPFICIGVAELCCLTMSKRIPMPFSDLNESLCNIIPDKKSFETLWDSLSDDNSQLTLLEALSSFYIDYRYPTIQLLARKLYVAYKVRPDAFFNIVLKAFSGIYEFASLFCYGLEDLTSLIGLRSESDFLVIQRQVYGFLKDGMLDFGKLDYQIKERNYSITDCRGVSIYSTLILLFAVYEKFGVNATSLGRGLDTGSERNLNKLQDTFRSCIGTDTTGVYLARGSYKLRPVPKSEEFFLLNIGINSYPLYGSQTFDINGVVVMREYYEGFLIFKKAFGVGDLEISDKFLNIGVVRYFGQVSNLWGSSYNLISEDVLNDNSEVLEVLQSIKSHAEKKKSSLTEEDIKERIAKAEEALIEKHTSEVNKLSKRIEELERILESKTDIISQMSLELADVNEKMHSFFTDDIVEETLETSVSIEDMVAFLKDYHLVMIGGRFDLPSKLCSYGLTDIVQIDEETPVSRLLKADFFVINTQFVSHKVVRMVESQFPEKRGEMFYYNGTNIENLITLLYNSISSWMERK